MMQTWGLIVILIVAAGHEAWWVQAYQALLCQVIQTTKAPDSTICLVCSAASFQPSLDKAGNAVGGTVTGRQWHEQKLTSRIQGWQDCLHKYMSNHKLDAGGRPDPCFFGDLLYSQDAVMLQTVQYSTVQYSTVQYSTVQYSTVQYSTVKYSTVQYSTVQYSTV